MVPIQMPQMPAMPMLPNPMRAPQMPMQSMKKSSDPTVIILLLFCCLFFVGLIIFIIHNSSDEEEITVCTGLIQEECIVEDKCEWDNDMLDCFDKEESSNQTVSSQPLTNEYRGIPMNRGNGSDCINNEDCPSNSICESNFCVENTVSGQASTINPDVENSNVLNVSDTGELVSSNVNPETGEFSLSTTNNQTLEENICNSFEKIVCQDLNTYLSGLTIEACLPDISYLDNYCGNVNNKELCTGSPILKQNGENICIWDETDPETPVCKGNSEKMNNICNQSFNNGDPSSCPSNNTFCKYTPPSESRCNCQTCPGPNGEGDNYNLVQMVSSVEHLPVTIFSESTDCREPNPDEMVCLNTQKIDLVNGVKTCVDCPSGSYGCPVDSPDENCKHELNIDGSQKTAGESDTTVCKRRKCYSEPGNYQKLVPSSGSSSGWECQQCEYGMISSDYNMISPDDATSNTQATTCVEGDELDFLNNACKNNSSRNPEWNYPDYINWFNRDYISEDNKGSWLPGHYELAEKSGKYYYGNGGTEIEKRYWKKKDTDGNIINATNGDVYYGLLPNQLKIGENPFKYSYMNSNGKWVHLCNCVKDDIESEFHDIELSEKSNHFTNCSCSSAEYLNYQEINNLKCSPLSETTCWTKGNHWDKDTQTIIPGSFWNIMDPYCNFFARTSQTSIGIESKMIDNEDVMDRCCIGCNHKVYKFGWADRNNMWEAGDNFPEYTYNIVDRKVNDAGEYLESGQLYFGGQDQDPIFTSKSTKTPDDAMKWRGTDSSHIDLSIGYNSRPYYYFPIYKNGTSKIGVDKENSHGREYLDFKKSYNAINNPNVELSPSPYDGTCTREHSVNSSNTCNNSSTPARLTKNLFTCSRTNPLPIQTTDHSNNYVHPLNEDELITSITATKDKQEGKNTGHNSNLHYIPAYAVVGDDAFYNSGSKSGSTPNQDGFINDYDLEYSGRGWTKAEEIDRQYRSTGWGTTLNGGLHKTKDPQSRCCTGDHPYWLYGMKMEYAGDQISDINPAESGMHVYSPSQANNWKYKNNAGDFWNFARATHKHPDSNVDQAACTQKYPYSKKGNTQGSYFSWLNRHHCNSGEGHARYFDDCNDDFQSRCIPPSSKGTGINNGSSLGLIDNGIDNYKPFNHPQHPSNLSLDDYQSSLGRCNPMDDCTGDKCCNVSTENSRLPPSPPQSTPPPSPFAAAAAAVASAGIGLTPSPPPPPPSTESSPPPPPPPVTATATTSPPPPSTGSWASRRVAGTAASPASVGGVSSIRRRRRRKKK